MTKANKQAKERAALKAELKAEVLAELKEAAKPPKPFVPEPYQRFDPTAGMSMQPSALRAMVEAVPDSVMRGVVRDNRGAPTRPTTMVPSASRQGGVHPGGGSPGTGWIAPTPLSNPPGTNYADRLMDTQDARDRAELIEREARFKAMEKLVEGKP